MRPFGRRFYATALPLPTLRSRLAVSSRLSMPTTSSHARARQVSKQIGQTFVLENRPCGGGTLGAPRSPGRPGRPHAAAVVIVAGLPRRVAQYLSTIR